MATVEVWGPNLFRSNHPETFHIHAKGCADVARHPTLYMPDTDCGGETIDAANILDVMTYVYPPGDFNYDETDETDRIPFESDIYVFPCVEFPNEFGQYPLTLEQRMEADLHSIGCHCALHD
jgi:hypothetical protein